jgi:hypothetical protein
LAKDVLLAADADVALTQAEGLLVESGGELAVGERIGFGGRDGVEGKSAEKGGVPPSYDFGKRFVKLFHLARSIYKL